MSIRLWRNSLLTKLLALASSISQAFMGTYPRTRSARPKGQAADTLRRCNASCFQAGQSAHVSDDQNPEPESLQSGRVINDYDAFLARVEANGLDREALES